jgi:hypothetical protein
MPYGIVTGTDNSSANTGTDNSSTNNTFTNNNTENNGNTNSNSGNTNSNDNNISNSSNVISSTPNNNVEETEAEGEQKVVTQPKDKADGGKDTKDTKDSKDKADDTNDKTELVDFTAKEFADIGLDKFLADEKVDKSTLEKIYQYEKHVTGGDYFQETLQKVFGDKAEAEFKYFRENSKNFINPQYSEKLDSLPADVKIMFLDIMNNVSRSMDSLKKEYGVTGQTQALSTPSPTDSRKEFDALTQRIMNGEYKSAEEFEAMKKQRLEMSLKLTPKGN